VLRQFGELPQDLIDMQKYAAWKAADINKALREGRQPMPGNSSSPPTAAADSDAAPAEQRAAAEPDFAFPSAPKAVVAEAPKFRSGGAQGELLLATVDIFLGTLTQRADIRCSPNSTHGACSMGRTTTPRSQL
jgi:hypothetical protein